MTDLIKRMNEALGEYEKALSKYGNPLAKDVLAIKARTLLPEAMKEIKRLEAKANQMVADKINLRSELISVQAKLAVAVEALERIASGALSGYVLTSNPPQDPAEAAASATLAKIKGEKH